MSSLLGQISRTSAASQKVLCVPSQSIPIPLSQTWCLFWPLSLQICVSCSSASINGITQHALLVSSFFILFFFFLLLMATAAAYGSFQARGRIGAEAAGLRHSHSNARSELHLQPMLQLAATLAPYPTEWGQGSNHMLVDTISDSLPSEPQWKLQESSLFSSMLYLHILKIQVVYSFLLLCNNRWICHRLVIVLLMSICLVSSFWPLWAHVFWMRHAHIFPGYTLGSRIPGF